MAQIQNLVIEQGSAFSVTITLKKFDATVRDLTGLTLKSTVKKSFQSRTSLLDLTCTTVLPPTNGQVTLSLTASETADLIPGRYVFDVISFNTSNIDTTTTRVLEGLITVTPGVTSAT